MGEVHSADAHKHVATVARHKALDETTSPNAVAFFLASHLIALARSVPSKPVLHLEESAKQINSCK